MEGSKTLLKGALDVLAMEAVSRLSVSPEVRQSEVDRVVAAVRAVARGGDYPVDPDRAEWELKEVDGELFIGDDDDFIRVPLEGKKVVENEVALVRVRIGQFGENL